MTRHSWTPKTVISPNKSERECERCGIVMASMHLWYPHGPINGRHWKEFYRGLDRIDDGGRTPVCEPVLEGVT